MFSWMDSMLTLNGAEEINPDEESDSEPNDPEAWEELEEELLQKLD